MKARVQILLLLVLQACLGLNGVASAADCDDFVASLSQHDTFLASRVVNPVHFFISGHIRVNRGLLLRAVIVFRSWSIGTSSEGPLSGSDIPSKG